MYPPITWQRKVPQHAGRLFRVHEQSEGIELAHAVRDEEVKDSVVDLVCLP